MDETSAKGSRDTWHGGRMNTLHGKKTYLHGKPFSDFDFKTKDVIIVVTLAKSCDGHNL